MKKIKFLLSALAIVIASLAVAMSPKVSLTVVPVAANQTTCERVGTCDDSITMTSCKFGNIQLYERRTEGGVISCRIAAIGLYTPD